MVKELTIRRPDDMHVHVRDGEMLHAVMPYTARQFARAIIMPNLAPEPVTTVAKAGFYRDRILVATRTLEFEPLMTLYLTEDTYIAEIELAAQTPFVHAFKYYPRGATTNSAQGVRDLRNAHDQLKALERVRLPLLLHGESNFDREGRKLDPFDKEAYFVREELPWLRETFPALRIVLEHITTKAAAEYVFRCYDMESGDNLAATVTPHHLVSDRRDMFEGGLNPHFFCLPVLKRREDMRYLREMVTGGLPCFFAGTDSAPHPTHAKERACGCAGGCFVAPIALSMYAQVFEEERELDNLERFLSENGANWYGLPLNKGTVTLTREDEAVTPESFVDVAGPGGKVRIFGTHDDQKQSLKWNWQVKA